VAIGLSDNREMADLDGPVRTLLEQMAGPAARNPVDLEAIGRAVAAFAEDRDYLRPWTDRLGPDGGSLILHAVPSGPRVTLVRRPAGHMSAVHDHGTWVAIAPIDGEELHRRYDIGDGTADVLPVPADVRRLTAGSFLTLLPPDDVHDHGHELGHGQPARLVIVTGMDQTLFTRTEWDPATGRRRTLMPGEGGRWLATEPFPAS
jgi:predicted metal-dependent enzyme (double-stranded beta helix superfamily)